mgnify:CR=1 FL=1
MVRIVLHLNQPTLAQRLYTMMQMRSELRNDFLPQTLVCPLKEGNMTGIE